MAVNLLSTKDLHERGITYSDTHRWRLIKAGKFPQPVKLGGARNAWVEAEIDEWVEARIAERDAG